MAFQDVLKATFPPMILAEGAGNASSRAAGSQVSAECWGSQDVEAAAFFGFMILKLTVGFAEKLGCIRR